MNTIRKYQLLVLALLVSQLITAVWLATLLTKKHRDIAPTPRRVSTTLPTQPAPAISPSPEFPLSFHSIT
ncbi:MAG: hypothetical protein ABSH20_25420, partial [Tepidisphaeraceae bacterium]